jgi:hypothetical protein
MTVPPKSDAPLTERPKSNTSDINPPVVPPLSEADPSVDPTWNEHVHDYFNADAHPGEAQQSASHEAKE